MRSPNEASLVNSLSSPGCKIDGGEEERGEGFSLFSPAWARVAEVLCVDREAEASLVPASNAGALVENTA